MRPGIANNVKKTFKQSTQIYAQEILTVLRNTSSSDIVGFKDLSYFDSGLKEMSPILYSVLKESVTNTKDRNRVKKKWQKYAKPHSHHVLGRLVIATEKM